MTRVAIGIYLHSEPDRLCATLAHIRAATTQPVDILLLADGPDAAMREALAQYRDLPQSTTDQPLGAAASFNRLLRSSDAELLIFLESGSLVGPGWLERLLAALQSDSRNGLAGPSTNLSWNLQAAFPCAGEADIALTAALAKQRFGESLQTLEPLHCLADFCYAVRRIVVETVGAADEGYGVGPCWEMDYSVRAARAGFRSVWAQGAFVHRRPFTARRRQDEDREFAASKQRYQDKFCGLRLGGQRTGYVDHCRGDRCPHFTPPEHIQIHLPIVATQSRVSASRGPTAAGTTPNSSAPARPLVSCIMPTRDRLEWMLQAVAYFQRQDYAERELIIIDDGEVDRSADLPCDPRIRYVRVPRKLSIGMKRNRACELARGQIIAHWDDDDWYAAGRLSAQVAPLLAGVADITGLESPLFFDLSRWEFWQCTPELHRRLFVLDVHGGTLVFRRHLFERLARYPDCSLAEDAQFLKLAVDRGARLRSVAAGDLFLYVRHGRNAWAFPCGQYLDPRGWQRAPEPTALAPDREFYAARSRVGPRSCASSAAPATQQVAAPPPAVPLPLVSCIMPTYNRRAFVPKAIEYFLRQDYPNRELVIVDDGEERVADLVPDHPWIRYLALPQRVRLGTKRNKAIEASRGELILHWDDDDWMDPRRISHQVSALLAANADLCGTSSVCFYEVATHRLSVYRYPPSQKRWVYGASLCYRRALWQQKPFEPLDIGEDTRFVWASPQGRVVDIGDLLALVAIVHSRNTSSPRPLSGAHWSVWRGAAPEQVFGHDWAYYQAMGEPAPARNTQRARLQAVYGS